ncbi:MAG: DUF4065 domain-containing protein [Hyphomicrobiales bacterium]|nr:DUF4065 domain-containing protein [Hyphomicrobiales bacterium]
MITPLEAGRALCAISSGSLSNIEMQKILYLAHMFYLGLNEDENVPLIDEEFEAWEFGPVSPTLYHHVKSFGYNNIPKTAFLFKKDIDREETEYHMLEDTYKKVKDKSALELVRITHWDQGAWAAVYVEGTRHIKIPNKMILDEFRARKTIPK